jgi:hypothetical protein
MRLSEFAQREPIDAIAAQTLTELWASRFDGELVFEVDGSGRPWRAHDLLSAYFDRDLSAQGRRYLRDGFRNTPRRSRRVAQWLLGTALASAPGLRASSRSAFHVQGDAPMEDLLVVPGNRRLRLLDFARRRAVVATKVGYESESLSVEHRMRTEHRADFMVPVLEADSDAGWLEEPLLEGWPLPRAPRAHDQRASLRWASDAVAQWAQAGAQSRDSESYLTELVGTLSEDLRLAYERFPQLPRVPDAWMTQLQRWASEAATVELLLSHGDLQAGNLWLDADASRVLILDWESCALRARGYDAWVQRLGTRSAVGLSQRIALAAADPGVQRAKLALFLLEDWQWFLTEALDVPGSISPGSLVTMHRELGQCLVAIVPKEAP